MGKQFPLIDDDLVVPLVENLQGVCCDGCGQAVPQYFLFGGPRYYVALGLRGRLMPTAIEKYGFKRACLRCMKRSFRGASPVAWFEAWRGLRASAQRDSLWWMRRLRLARVLGKTPPYTSFEQRMDWPVCCGSCCEYLGYPINEDDLLRVVEECRYWDAGVCDLSPIDDAPEVVSSPATQVNRFGCLSCDAKYYTFQRT